MENALDGHTNETYLKVSISSSNPLDDEACSCSCSSVVNGFQAIPLSLILEELELQLQILNNASSAQTKENQRENNDHNYITTLVNIISDTKKEIEHFQTYNVLREFNKEQLALISDEEIAEDKIKASKNLIWKQKAEICKINYQIQDQKLESQQMIEILKDAIYDEEKRGSSDADYVKCWSENKLEFEYIKFKSILEFYDQELIELEQDFQRTKTSRNNISKWSVLRNDEIQEQINKWTIKFQNSYQILNGKIKKKQELISIQQTLINELEEAINERMTELKPWEEEREQERQDRINHLRRFYSARKIQRFWRSYMVKHTLYKKKKIPKKKVIEQKPSKKTFAFL